MKKVLKSRIFIVIITMIICISGTLYATTKYNASEILYNPSNGEATNVNDALNEIYNIKKLGTATADDIIKGKTAVVHGKLITGTGAETTKKVFSVMLNPEIKTIEDIEAISVDAFSNRGEGSKSSSYTDNVAIEIPFFKEIDGDLCIISSISFTMSAQKHANSSGDAASSYASYKISLPDETVLISKKIDGTDHIISSANIENVNISIFDYNVGEFDKFYIKREVAASTYGGKTHDYSHAIANASVSAIKINYIVIK